MLKVPLKEAAIFNNKQLNKELDKLNKKPIETLEKQLQEAAVAP